MNYLAIFYLSQFQEPQVRPCGPKMGLIIGWQCELKKNHPRVSECSLPDGVKQKSAFQNTWFSNKQ